MEQQAAGANKITGAEKITYALYFFGQNIFYFIVTSMLQIYLTNSVGLAAATVGVLFLVVKVWDAVNDPIFGMFVDKIRLTGGKFLPWVRLSTFFIPATTVFMFFTPVTFPMWLRVSWSALAYILWDTAYTICDAPVTGLSMAMTDSVKERTDLISIGRLGAIVAIFGSAIVPALAARMGYSWAVLILSVFSMAAMLPVGFTAKERFDTHSKEESTVKEILRGLVQNKYLLLFYLAYVLASLTGTAMAVMNYLAVYCLGGAHMVSVNMMVCYGPMLASVVILSVFSKRADKFHIYMASLAVYILAGAAQYFAGYGSFGVYAVFAAVKGVSFGLQMILVYAFTADCAIYSTYKTGTHTEGVTFSLQTFAVKMTSALSAAIVMFILGAAGYISGEGNTYPAQSAESVRTIWFLGTLFPGLGLLVQFMILLTLYRLRDKYVKIMADANNGTIPRAQAEALLPKRLF